MTSTPKTPKSRKLVVINLIRSGSVDVSYSRCGDIEFEVTEHQIGWNLELAESLIRHYDGSADGICLSGVQKEVASTRTRIAHPVYIRLMRLANRTPIYVADDVREVLTDWTLKRVLREQPQLFRNREVFFQSALLSPVLQAAVESGGRIVGGDALLIGGAPLLLWGERQLDWFLAAGQSVMKLLANRGPRSQPNLTRRLRLDVFQRALRRCDIFVGFGNMIGEVQDLSPLKGKVVIMDCLDAASRMRLQAVEPALIIELIPTSFNHFSIMAAMVDQTRLSEQSPKTFAEYLLDWIQKHGVKPNPIQKAESSSVVRKCAFIIHALSQDDLWKTPGLKFMAKAPTRARKMAERGLAHLPCFYFGKIEGVISEHDGQRVECDLYAMAATPRQLLAMNPETAYRKLIQCIDLAKKNGASLVGLGAYTKVIGDAGVSVARRASLPVTNGNSYSAATTLWAARLMVEKMGMVPPAADGRRMRAKAMVIGATGGIGRVSALLLSLAFDEIVLAANRVDKLLEIRDEILALSPETRITITTRAASEAPDTDLIVIATSNQSGSVIDINSVKPGAVICDCSRPLDITPEQARLRPDVLVVESGEVILPGPTQVHGDIGLPKPVVYACLAETVLLALEGRFESFSLSKNLQIGQVKEIYKLGLKHGARLASIGGPFGLVDDALIERTRHLALQKLAERNPGLTTSARISTHEQHPILSSS